MKLYLHSFSFNGYQDTFLNTIDVSSPGPKFFMNLARRFRPSRFISRSGVWSLPFDQEVIPKLLMPRYDSSFKLTFEEVTDLRAIEIKKRVQQGEKFALFYSGGIDSTVILIALLKNLSTEEMRNIAVVASIHSIIENPNFWQDHIQDKLLVIDSNQNKYDDLILMGYTPIAGDEGDSMFGTMLGINFFNNFEIRPDDQRHFSFYEDKLIPYLGLKDNEVFGEMLYRKIKLNIETSDVPIHSLNDFFWWIIFNLKYTNCATRCPLYYNNSVDFSEAVNRTVNWYNTDEYQLWSMTNNNNGLKIQNTIMSYKKVAKDYIWEFDKNDWYRDYKAKLESLNFIVGRQPLSEIPPQLRPSARIGFDNNFSPLYVDDIEVQRFFKESVESYKVDW